MLFFITTNLYLPILVFLGLALWAYANGKSHFCFLDFRSAEANMTVLKVFGLILMMVPFLNILVFFVVAAIYLFSLADEKRDNR